MTALSTLTETLKRELAVPGTFDDVFPDTGDSDLVGALADGFAEAQLNGYFTDMSLEVVTGGEDWETSSDLSLAGGALVVIFTSMRTIRAQLRNLNSGERYKAGAAEFEVNRSATLLREELAYLQKRLDDLIANSRRAARASAGTVAVFDNYLARGGDISQCGGLHPYEFKAG